MAIRTFQIGLLVLIGVAVISNPCTLWGHVYIERAMFTYSKHPDLPLENFARGELGVLQPTYARSYLYVAYRHLLGTGFDPEEQKALVALWEQRLLLRWGSGKEVRWGSTDDNIAQMWIDARSKVPGLPTSPEIDAYHSREGQQYYFQSYLNCTEDAFRTAARTLNARVQKVGAGAPEIKDWVQAQDQVFTNCSKGPSIPAAAKPDAHPLIRADRAYQIASANFYAGKFDAAEKAFGEIARDSSSPWRSMAPFLIARTLIRKATVDPGSKGPGANEPDKDLLAKAEAQLKQVLSDGRLRETHAAAQRLLGFVRLRLYPRERLHELAAALFKKNSAGTLKQDLWDYTLLLDKFVGDNEDYGEQKIEKRSERFKLLSDIRDDAATDWILTFQAASSEAFDYALRKWEETGSVPWLVASLSKIGVGHMKLPELLKAADKVKPDAPGFASVSFHSLCLMMASGKKQEARARLDAVRSHGGRPWLPATRNLFLALGLRLARNFDELLQYAQRVSLGTTLDEDDQELPDLTQVKATVLFDVDGAKVLNRELPLALLRQAATRDTLPAHLRREVAIAAWVRSVVLDNEVIGKEMVPILEGLAPELKESLHAYVSAESPEARRFAAVFLILKSPGLRPVVNAGLPRRTLMDKIDNFRDNWWCSLDPVVKPIVANWVQMGIDGPRFREVLSDTNPETLEFFDEAQRAAAKAERAQLLASGAGPNYLSRQVVEWVKRNPNDPRAAEALHLAVRSTRYGCTDQETTKFSKAAFQLLHKQYPNSSWAKKTKYWY